MGKLVGEMVATRPTRVPLRRRPLVRRSGELALAGGVAGGVAATAVAGTIVVGATRRRRRRRLSAAPWGPAGLQLPPGLEVTVSTDDGAELAVTVAGPDRGPTVVLTHCWSGTRAVWGAVARRLVLDGHRVVLYDHRAHGASTAGTSVSTVARLGADLCAVLEQLDVRDSVLVGHSMGGMAVQAFAIDHPEVANKRVRGLVLASTTARIIGRRLPASPIEYVLGDGRFERLLQGRIGRVVTRPALGRRVRRAHMEATRVGLVGTSGLGRAGCLVAMTAMDLRPSLDAIKWPTTVVGGSLDVLIPIPLVRSLAARIPGAELVVLPGAGHMLPLEETDRVIDIIRSHTQSRANEALVSNVG